MKGKYMGILYETARAAQNNTAENEFSFNRSLESEKRNDSDRRIVREVQEQKGQVSIEQVQEFQRPARDYASIGSDVKKALEKADQMDAEKEMPPVSAYVQPACEGWIELLGAGVVHPKVLEMAGIDSEVYTGWAFGLGLERLALRRFKIDDLRLIFENDVRFLEQF